tara:strand:- start:221 stop:481 length:261 start_codon:yes stop_codon:yes gene_type:complete
MTALKMRALWAAQSTISLRKGISMRSEEADIAIRMERLLIRGGVEACLRKRILKARKRLLPGDCLRRCLPLRVITRMSALRPERGT